ncbi:MAG: hypothetical protein JEY79_18500 [Pseudodesulfovibrio sp.]|nr:hypothetical protein [Pseudodesulfovibrio sp.]
MRSQVLGVGCGDSKTNSLFFQIMVDRLPGENRMKQGWLECVWLHHLILSFNTSAVEAEWKVNRLDLSIWFFVLIPIMTWTWEPPLYGEVPGLLV